MGFERAGESRMWASCSEAESGAGLGTQPPGANWASWGRTPTSAPEPQFRPSGVPAVDSEE